jgi:hypothetical protein
MHRKSFWFQWTRNFLILILGPLALLLAIPTAGRPQSAGRTVDFTQQLTGLDGKSIPLTVGGPPLTLSDVAVAALEAQFGDEQTMPGAKKFELYELARKIYNKKDVALTAEEAATLKDRIGRFWGPAIVGAAWPLLDPNVRK